VFQIGLDKKAVIPAQAGIQTLRAMPIPLGSGFRRNDNFLSRAKLNTR